MNKAVIFINSHPIQYFAPMYNYMNKEGVKTICWYCSDENVKGSYDQEFGVNVKWDIPLLQGYDYLFFKNYSFKPSYDNGFFGLINLGMIWQLFKIKKSIIVVHGYHYFTHLSILLLGKFLGHTICLRNDIPESHERFKNGWKNRMRRLLLKFIVFPRIDYFLYIGNQNKLLYQRYGVSDNRLLFCPYSVDNDRLSEKNIEIIQDKIALKKKLGISAHGKVILYSGKYIAKKRPLDLIKAFIQLNKPNCWLVMMGEGELRGKMEELLHRHNIKQCILTGFVNQTKVSEFYAISDVFVMCSTLGENWGLSVNEAMNFNLPIILSDLTGCSDDLVMNGVNGYIFKTGDIRELTLKLKQVLYENELSWAISSKTIIKNYSYSSSVFPLKKIIRKN